MTVREFSEKGRTLCAVSPEYPPNSYAADLRAMLPKALKALEISCEALRNIDGPQRSMARAIADSREALADV